MSNNISFDEQMRIVVLMQAAFLHGKLLILADTCDSAAKAMEVFSDTVVDAQVQELLNYPSKN